MVDQFFSNGAEAFNYSWSGITCHKKRSIYSSSSSDIFLTILMFQQRSSAIFNHSGAIIHVLASLINVYHVAKIIQKVV